MKNNLPQGWEWSTLDELSLKISDGSHNPPKGKETGIPMLSAKNIQDNNIHFDDARLISEEDYQNEVSRVNISAGDVLLTIVGTIGRTAVVAEGLPKFSLQRSVAIIKPKVDSKFLAYYLRSPSIQQYLSDNAKGTAQKGIYLNALKKVPVCLPPLPEQHRIVAQLEATMQKLEASQGRLEKLPLLLKKFRQAVLAAAVSGKLTEAWRAEQPQGGETAAELLDRIRAERRAQWEAKQIAKMKGKQLSLDDSWKHKYEELPAPDTTDLPELPHGWIWESVDLLSERIVDCPHSTPEFTKEGEYCIDTNCIESGRIRFDKARFVTPSCYLERISRLEPKEGDILFAREGTIGTTAMVPANIKLCLGQRMMMFRPAELIPSYFMWTMISDVFVRQWRPKVMGTTAQHVNIRDLRVMALPVCSLDEQEEIVRQVNHYFELADQLEARFEQAVALVKQLPQALLAKAFSGQLVPQDPNDEPASALLERLGAEVAAPVKGKRGRKPKAMADAPLFE